MGQSHDIRGRKSRHQYQKPKMPARWPMAYPLDFPPQSGNLATFQSWHFKLQKDSIRPKDPHTSNISMTPTALRALAQNGTGIPNQSSLAFANVALLHAEEKPLDDQDDESNLESWPQSTPKQSRLMSSINQHPYKMLTICAFTAITLMVIYISIIGKLAATSFRQNDCSYQCRRVSPEALLYCKYDLHSKASDRC